MEAKKKTVEPDQLIIVQEDTLIKFIVPYGLVLRLHTQNEDGYNVTLLSAISTIK